MPDLDGTLYRRLQERDPQALEEVIRQFAHPLLGMIRRILAGMGSSEDAEEVLADTFFAVWYDIDKYDPQRAPLSTWIWMLAKYAALDRRRQLGRRPRTLPLLEELDVPRVTRSTIDRAGRWDLHQTLSTLPDLERELIYRRYFLQESLAEIAEQVEASVHAVRNRLWRTRRQLAGMVQP